MDDRQPVRGLRVTFTFELWPEFDEYIRADGSVYRFVWPRRTTHHRPEITYRELPTGNVDVGYYLDVLADALRLQEAWAHGRFIRAVDRLIFSRPGNQTKTRRLSRAVIEAADTVRDLRGDKWSMIAEQVNIALGEQYTGEALRQQARRKLGITLLSLYGFSSDNTAPPPSGQIGRETETRPKTRARKSRKHKQKFS
jgi:hypothetical protein